MTKQMVFATVETYVSIDYESLKEFRDYLDGWIEKYGPNARFEFQDDYEGDKSLVIKSERLETDEEYNRRLVNERNWKEYQDKRDLEAYERLKKKFEGEQ